LAEPAILRKRRAAQLHSGRRRRIRLVISINSRRIHVRHSVSMKGWAEAEGAIRRTSSLHHTAYRMIFTEPKWMMIATF
jgi:hypothetical protein